ncbi:MAG: hypothetical protein ACREMB_14645 [Candidatus Rokuibacteriota bacterium]
MWFRRKPTHRRTLTRSQEAIVAKVFDLLRVSSGHFTQDRLFYLVGDEYALWTDDCTEALRARIEAAAPAGIQIRLRFFRMAAGCLSLECLPARIAA